MSISTAGVYGQGHDKVGYFVCRGEVQGSKVYFRKQYIGAHSVDYWGEFHAHGHHHGHGSVDGNWCITSSPHDVGTFHLASH